MFFVYEDGQSSDDEEVGENGSIEDEARIESVTQVISKHVIDLRSLLKNNLSSEDFLSIDGKSKDQFENTYINFIKRVRTTENYITEYIKVRMISF